MINLLPIDDKLIIRAGRANRLLVRYVLLTLSLIVLIFIIFAAVWIQLTLTESGAKQKITESEEATKNLSSEVASISEFEKNLASSKQVLSKQVNYSEILLKFASTIPSNTVIDSITLSPELVGKPTSFIAQVKDASTAIKLKDSLQKSPYFSDVYFENLTSKDESKYGYSVTMNVTINKELLK